MRRLRKRFDLVLLLSAGLIAAVPARSEPADPPGPAEASEVEALREKLRQLRQEVAALRSAQLGGMSEQARRELLDAQIEHAYQQAKRLADSRGPADLLAGIDEKGRVFFKSADGQFTARISALVQVRYLWNNLNTNSASGSRASDSLSGFAINRARLGISGEVGDGWGYKIMLGTVRVPDATSGEAVGDTVTEDAYITYDFDENWKLRAGVARAAFARQELVSATRQVAVARSLVTEFFTLNRVDHVELSYRDGRWWARFTLSDGANANASGAFTDASNDFALTGRLDWNVFENDWSLGGTEFASDERGLFLGGAVHYEVAEGVAATNPYDDFLAWTADALWKGDGLGLTAAVFGNHASNLAAADADQYGLYTQANVMINDGLDAFARWEVIDDDDFTAVGTDPLQAVTLGLNRHFNERVKLTGDVVWVYAGDNQTPAGAINGGELSSGVGLTSTGFNAADNHSDQVVFRLQLQMVY